MIYSKDFILVAQDRPFHTFHLYIHLSPQSLLNLHLLPCAVLLHIVSWAFMVITIWRHFCFISFMDGIKLVASWCIFARIYITTGPTYWDIGPVVMHILACWTNCNRYGETSLTFETSRICKIFVPLHSSKVSIWLGINIKSAIRIHDQTMISHCLHVSANSLKTKFMRMLWTKHVPITTIYWISNIWSGMHCQI